MIIIDYSSSAYQQWSLTEEDLHTSQSSHHHHYRGKYMVPHQDWSRYQHLWCCFHLLYHNLHIQAPPLHTESLYYSLHILKEYHHMFLQTVLESMIPGCYHLLEALDFICNDIFYLSNVYYLYIELHILRSLDIYSHKPYQDNGPKFLEEK